MTNGSKRLSAKKMPFTITSTNTKYLEVTLTSRGKTYITKTLRRWRKKLKKTSEYGKISSAQGWVGLI